ncbi:MULTISPECIES: DUF1295 domain-containing protein [unclassified Lentimicrobium]|uniref:DUF1295 domain-containing protein n=1 Tax=unclassified Lentimicrobium TaxID=2677434 RepID=UPI001552C501|nr:MULTISPECIES: DUF1295 domain-containing protein [unclassified Lentimicrobium]NPD45995.1 DUF1295 domain-containing protein [Lentimicrobium sp. S6]NPD85194.1 DUF1295 domain-containing protein [Lentimicrobium sp. L6]
MDFQSIYFQGLALIKAFMTILWVISVIKKNASIVDAFWGAGFVLLVWFYFFQTEGLGERKILITTLVSIWGLRLSLFIGKRNWGKPEDFRYQKFRQDYGAHRYWWVSFFQTFILQGVLLWLISAPLLGAQSGINQELNFIDYAAAVIWLIGFAFEAGGDYQLAKFEKEPNNKGKVLSSGFWKYTRHPNYFGDGFQWIAFALFSIANACYLPILSAVLMNFLLVKISGVALLEKTLSKTKPQYQNYINRTPAYIPWLPKS